MKTPITVNSVQTLTMEARESLAEVGIYRAKTKNKQVLITQHAPIGTSFQFIGTNEPEKEFHIPERMVKECFI